MKSVITGLLVFILIYLIVDIFAKQSSFGLFNQEIKNTLLGNVDEFIDPMNKSSFLEFIHMEIFFLMMILLTLSAIFIRLSYKRPSSITLTNIVMISGLLSIITLSLSYFSSEKFINLYILCFFIWHLCALYMSIYSLWKLNFAKNI